MALVVQNGSLLKQGNALASGAACCCGGCGEPCSKCFSPCLSLSISGFAGSSEGAECEECDAINGTYTLTRGSGAIPVITAFIESDTGSGAAITAALGFQSGDGSYTITSVSVDEPGTCYDIDSMFAYTISGAVVACDDPPVVTLDIERSEPELDISEIGDVSDPEGTGAVLSPVYVPVATTPGGETWAIDSVTVTSGGIDYDAAQSVTVQTKGCTVAISPAVLTIAVDASEPSPISTFIQTTGGSGATLSVTWTPIDSDLYGIQHWRPVISASGGTGYGQLDKIIVDFPAGTFSGPTEIVGEEFIGYVSSVSNSGEILAVQSLLNSYYSSVGEIQSVAVVDGGEYYTPGGIKSATVVDGGTFWVNEPCRYTVCGPSACTAEGGPQCRRLSLAVGATDSTLSISFDGGPLIEATIPAEGTSCGNLSFGKDDITSSCATVGTLTVSAAECSGGPADDSCCDPCSGPCDAENQCPDGCACVGGECRTASACCYWSCDYVAELVWPDIENPEDIPDVSEAMIAAGWGLVGGQWLKTIRGEENCNDPEQAAAKFQALEAEINAIVGGQGGLSFVTNGFFFGPGCMDCATQQECEETYLGTFHAGKTCLENPCCSGACDEENSCPNTLATGWDCDCVGEECVPAENPLP